jgi:gluconokinase
VGDGACSNLGCGATGKNRVALMIGTSGALRVLAGEQGERPPLPAGLWRYQADASRYLLGGALSNGGNVWDWLTDTLRLPADLPPADLDQALGAMRPDSHGLTVLPFLNGERAPLWRDDVRAAVVGLSAATTPLDLARAHLEAVALRFAAVRERLRDVTGPGTEIIGTGGGLKTSPAWTQILADALGEPILVSHEEQASSRGAALLVRERLGIGRVADVPLSVSARVTPDPDRHETYRRARARQEALLERPGPVHGRNVESTRAWPAALSPACYTPVSIRGGTLPRVVVAATFGNGQPQLRDQLPGAAQMPVRFADRFHGHYRGGSRRR